MFAWFESLEEAQKINWKIPELVEIVEIWSIEICKSYDCFVSYLSTVDEKFYSSQEEQC